MSRYVEEKFDEKLNKTLFIETIASMDECKNLINEVCTEALCDVCCDFPSISEYCNRCRYFVKEDGVIKN